METKMSDAMSVASVELVGRTNRLLARPSPSSRWGSLLSPTKHAQCIQQCVAPYRRSLVWNSHAPPMRETRRKKRFPSESLVDSCACNNVFTQHRLRRR